MTVFLGQYGKVKLRRSAQGTFSSAISPDDVNTTLNRLGFDGSLENLLTGDRVDITTDDPRGLECFPVATWPASGATENAVSLYVNVNQAGGLRFFRSFAEAVNNTRSTELSLASFSGAPIPIGITVRDADFNLLGNVTSYEINTDREAIDTTTLSDKFKQQYTAGLISGNGTINCQFNYETSGIEETSLLMLQLIQRVDLGAAFDCALFLTDNDTDSTLQTVYYEISALVTSAGVTVNTDSVIECTINFVSAGEIRLLVGKPSGYILQEDDYKIRLEQSLDFLLQETED
ncbi:hypothetical protein EBT31_01000 [bacterium]|jgi:hypothetical protein|nr:hypothetical protein [bacterium]